MRTDIGMAAKCGIHLDNGPVDGCPVCDCACDLNIRDWQFVLRRLGKLPHA